MEYVYFLVFVGKFQPTEDVAYLKIFSLYSILISHDSPTKKIVIYGFEEYMVTHEERNILFSIFLIKLQLTEDAANLEIFSLYSILS